MAKTVYILKGLPASGKTSYAKKLIDENPGRYKRVNKDDLRSLLDNGHWSKGNEKFVLKVRDAIIAEALKEGYHVIVDDTNLHSKHEKAIREIVDWHNEVERPFEKNVEVKIKDFTDVPVEECIKRDGKRENPVGEKVIRDMYNQFLKPEPVKGPEYDPNLPDCLWCDLDGTIALGIEAGHRGPYDWDKVGQDKVDPAVLSILRKFHKEIPILFMSGRDGRCYDLTKEWLMEQGFEIGKDGCELHMRTEGDNRKDSIVKRELYEQFIKGKFNVLFCLDDRSQVVKMLREELGLKVLQVSSGEF